ncbi:recombinase family protein [Catellicoccus marimammalium]|uniref:Site-specific recombinase, DNA invertase Pin related protein n=1 Tax=Catellicoccus marimammalium M35/04/3 TaxID=1234409 RepID=K8Z8L2_9ENTE|nr:recombinase family protein [Catellicoccus marimammalium]EKU27225.1 Site-specific recombinase, DNA invertase Pin related protein [Catellicoccus marimammalium M35/04/3]
MKIGYARVSTREQNLDRQLDQLEKAGCKKIFQEKLSGKNMDRPALQNLLSFIREDDEVIVVSLDRLGRSSQDITAILEKIKQKGATINILNLPSFEGITDPNLKNLLTNLVLEIQKYISEQERQTLLERQKEGIRLAKERGAYKGGVVQYSKDSKNPQRRLIYETVVDMLERKRNGEPITIQQIANHVGITRSTVYRIKKEIEEIENKTENLK